MKVSTVLVFTGRCLVRCLVGSDSGPPTPAHLFYTRRRCKEHRWVGLRWEVGVGGEQAEKGNTKLNLEDNLAVLKTL